MRKGGLVGCATQTSIRSMFRALPLLTEAPDLTIRFYAVKHQTADCDEADTGRVSVLAHVAGLPAHVTGSLFYTFCQSPREAYAGK
jgi:hypothetical protein